MDQPTLPSLPAVLSTATISASCLAVLAAALLPFSAKTNTLYAMALWPVLWFCIAMWQSSAKPLSMSWHWALTSITVLTLTLHSPLWTVAHG